MDNRPIGVFDSGLGGLSALAELEKLLPRERLLYFGDSLRMPYGNRDNGEILRFTERILRFMRERDVKLLAVACGTMSSVAMPVLGCGCGLPYVDVIAPAARAAADAGCARVGVLATAATVRSHSYEQALLALKPGLEVISVAAPRLVPLVEEGHLSPDDPVLTEAVEKSVAAIRASRVELMILGCTHYPLISSAIDKALHGRVRLIDNSRELAKSLSKTLCRLGLEADGESWGGSRFFTSGDPAHFSRIASRMLGRDLSGLVQTALQDD